MERQKVKLSAEAIEAIDAERGRLSRSEYVDRLLKKYQGVTRYHTPDRDCKKHKQK